MRGLDLKTFALMNHVANLRGGSQPILARAEDGELYVVKIAGNPQGPNLLFNEAMGSELFQSCGLAVPEWKPLRLTDAFLDRNPGCWFQTAEGSRRPQAGWCFGSRYLGGRGERILELLPGNSFKRVRKLSSFWRAWLLDIAAGHADNRQAIFVSCPDGFWNAFFVDFGHLFAGPKGEQHLPFQASRYLDGRIYVDVPSQYLQEMHEIARCLDTKRLWRCVEALPEEWKTATALQSFARSLDRLSGSEWIAETLDTMLHAVEQGRQHERERQQGREVSLPVLRFGVQAAGVGKGCDFECAGYSACA